MKKVLYHKQPPCDAMENNIHKLYWDTTTLAYRTITGSRSDILAQSKTTMKVPACDIRKSVDSNLEFECDKRCYTDTTTITA
jgi:hypothetical protein